MKTICLFLSFMILVLTSAFGQVQIPYNEPILATSKTSMDHQVVRVKHAPKNKYIRIIRTDIKDIAYGNRCVSQATHRMGFEYVPMPISEVEEKSQLHYFLHNQGARFKLTLKNGPFWQRKLKRYIRECRRTTGDFNG